MNEQSVVLSLQRCMNHNYKVSKRNKFCLQIGRVVSKYVNPCMHSIVVGI